MRATIVVFAGLVVVAPFVLARLLPEHEVVKTPQERAVTACHREVGKLVDFAWKYPKAHESVARASAGGDWVVSGAVDGRRGFGHPRRWFVCSVRLIGDDAFSPSRGTVVFDSESYAEEAATTYVAGLDWPAGLPGEIARG
jgi:hypothetical protein